MLTGVCGSAGLILANCVNMTIRIVCSLKFIKDFFTTTSYNPLRCSIPSARLLLTFIVVSIITVMSEVMSFMKSFTYLPMQVDLFLLCKRLAVEICSCGGGANMFMLAVTGNSLH